MGVPPIDCFLEKILENGWFGGTPILGNLHMYAYVIMCAWTHQESSKSENSAHKLLVNKHKLSCLSSPRANHELQETDHQQCPFGKNRGAGDWYTIYQHLPVVEGVCYTPPLINQPVGKKTHHDVNSADILTADFGLQNQDQICSANGLASRGPSTAVRYIYIYI